jgi:predicted NodU family carbamoyl transferase
MRLLSINIGPDSSATLLENGEVTSYLSAERVSRKKHDSDIFEILEYLPEIDDLNYSDIIVNDMSYDDEVLLRVEKFIADKFKFKRIDFNRNDGRLPQAYCGFFNSPFNKALCFVSNEGVYRANRKSIKEIYQADTFERTTFSLGPKFGLLAKKFGFEYEDASKIVDLSQWFGYEVGLDSKWREMVDESVDLQEESENEMIELIRKHYKETGIDNIVLTGDYASNHVANSKIKKEFPELNFFIDPLRSVSIGEAYKYYKKNSFFRKKIKPLKNVYIGTPLQYDQLKTKYSSYQVLFGTVYEDMLGTIARIMTQGIPVAIAQGQSEGGFKSLGNRSIVLDPRAGRGWEQISKIEQDREEFVPFGASILQDTVKEWFEFEGESPFMEYVAKGKPDWNTDLFHYGRCCIHTVTKEQNYHYYRLLQEFYECSNIPMLVNIPLCTSDEPIAETLDQVIESLLKLGVTYLYLPERECIVRVI